MGILGKIKKLNFLKRVGLGFTDAIGISSILKSNVESQHITKDSGEKTGLGKIDWIRLIVTLSFMTLFYMFASGKISEEMFEKIASKLIKLF